MRVSAIDSRKSTLDDYINLVDISYDEDFINLKVEWKKSKDEGVKYYRDEVEQSTTIIMLETSPYFNLKMFDDACLNSSVPRLVQYGYNETIFELLGLINVPVD